MNHMVLEYVASYLSWTNLFWGFFLCESSTLIRWLLSPINIRYFTLLLELWFIAVNDCFPNFGDVTCVVSLDDHSLSFLKSLAVLILLLLFIETLIFFLFFIIQKLMHENDLKQNGSFQTNFCNCYLSYWNYYQQKHLSS